MVHWRIDDKIWIPHLRKAGIVLGSEPSSYTGVIIYMVAILGMGRRFIYEDEIVEYANQDAV